MAIAASNSPSPFSPNYSVSAPHPNSDMAKSATNPSPPDSISSQTLDNTSEFSGDVNTNNDIPSQGTLKSVENLPILDVDGRAIPFKNLYTGPNVARRVLVIFIRHFFCGNCQEYIRSLTASISPADLLQLPTPTFIAVVGCGSPSLIKMYQRETGCPFPIYADPTKKLYSTLGMVRTLNIGPRPEYQRKELLSMITSSVMQAMKMMTRGQALQGGDMAQVGGEFLFEPIDLESPIATPDDPFEEKRLGEGDVVKGQAGMLEHGAVEEKHVTWCHRMRNTRDHAEIPELREVLGLDGEGAHGKNKKRWTRAMGQRKGTGLSQRSMEGAKVKELDRRSIGSSERAGSGKEHLVKDNLEKDKPAKE